jgi:sugar/nucleoside kinase (ribokinase family)
MLNVNCSYMYDIITIGSATRDVFLQSKGFKVVKDHDFATGQAECFGLGSKTEVQSIVFATGGGGTNSAVTFARQGLKTACIGAIGDDLNGKELLSELEKEGVDAQYFQISDKNSGTAYSVILVNEDGERTILSYKGEGQSFDVTKIPFDKIKTRWMFLDSLGGHYDLLEKSVNWAIENDIKLATNPGGKELEHGIDKLRPLLKYFSIVIMNQEEASGLSGIDYKKEDEIFKFMDEAVDGIFVMTKGPNGVAVSDGDNIYRAGIPNSPIIERTGAGDAFSSGFVVEYIRATEKQETLLRPSFVKATAGRQGYGGQASDKAIMRAIQITGFGAKEGILKKDDRGEWPLVKVEQAQL